MLQMTRQRMKLQNQTKKPLKGKRRHKILPREEVQLHRNLRSTLGKKQQKQKFQNQKKRPQKFSSKTKNTDENINSDPKEPKMATRSSSPLKSVPEKSKIYITEQHEEYFSSQETDDVFVSG